MEEVKTLGIELRNLMQTMKRKMHDSVIAIQPDHVTLMHTWVISYLYEQGENDVFQRDFEKKFAVRRSTATKMLQLMEKNGLIRRESVPHDARLKKLILTEKAAKMHENMISKMMELDAQLLHGFTEEEKHTLFALLEKVRGNIS